MVPHNNKRRRRDEADQSPCMLELREKVMQYLDNNHNPYLEESLLTRLWRRSYVEGELLVLSGHDASYLAASHPEGYHSGLWYLVVEYEMLMAMAMLTNSNPNAPGYAEPKSFSAWPRRHTKALYKKAAAAAAFLSLDDSWEKTRYWNMMSRWHKSITYISHVSGDTRLDRRQLTELVRVLDRDFPS